MKSLRNCTNWHDTLDDLLKFYRHPANYGKLLILVEGARDEYFYKQYFDGKYTFVKQTEGSKNMEDIDKILLTKYKEIKCIIIEDSDFNNLDHFKAPIDSNTFYTDAHDLEMSCLLSERCKISFFKHLGLDINTELVIFEDLQLLSYCRWYNEMNGCHNDFTKISENISSYSSEEMKNFTSIYSSVMKHDVKDSKGRHLNTQPIEEKTLNNFISDREVKGKMQYDLHNGHDFLGRIIHYMKGKDGEEIKENTLFGILKDCYTSDDFKSSNLVKKLNEWSRNYNIKLMS